MEDSLYCPLCQVSFPSSYQRAQHFNGKKRARVVKIVNGANANLYCDLCKVSFPSDYQKEQHFNGQKHQRTERRAHRELDEEICQMIKQEEEY